MLGLNLEERKGWRVAERKRILSSVDRKRWKGGVPPWPLSLTTETVRC